MAELILWKTAVTDRAQNDVDLVNTYVALGWSGMTSAQQTAWIAGLKGSLNTADLTRIENNVQLLSDVLELGLTTYYGNVPELPTTAYFKTLLSNVDAIRKAYCIHATTPETPAEPVNAFGKVNDIEQILADVHSILLDNFHYYAGDEIYSGDTTGLLL